MEKHLTVFSPGLQSIPGWVGLSREKQDWLVQKTSNLIQYRRMEGLGAIGACMELMGIETGLETTDMSMRSYLRTIYGQSEVTAKKRLRDFKELRKLWSDKVIEALAKKGGALLRGAAGVGVRDLVNVAKALPPPKSDEAKVVESFILNEVRTTIAKQRSGRSKGERILKLSEETAAKILTNDGIRVMRNLKLETSAQKRRFLQLVCGWLMEAEGVTGTLSCSRISIPEGVLVKRGRPRKKPKISV